MRDHNIALHLLVEQIDPMRYIEHNKERLLKLPRAEAIAEIDRLMRQYGRYQQQQLARQAMTNWQGLTDTDRDTAAGHLLDFISKDQK